MNSQTSSNRSSPLGIWVVRLRWFWPLAAVLHMAFIYWSSDRTWEGSAGHLAPGVTNFVHFGLYGFLAGLLFLAVQAHRGSGTNWDIWVWLVVAGFGLFDEFHQSWVPGRDFSLWDVLTDGTGAIFATTYLSGILRAKNRRNRCFLLGSLVLGLLASFIFPQILPNL